MKSFGIPGVHQCAKLRRARLGGFMQGGDGRELLVPDWASSNACACEWRLGYKQGMQQRQKEIRNPSRMELTAEEAVKNRADDIGRLLDMIGQEVNRMAAEPTWPVAGTLASSRQSLIDILVHVGDLDEGAIKETMVEMRDDGTGAQAGGA